jgi:hypothetical protein
MFQGAPRHHAWIIGVRELQLGEGQQPARPPVWINSSTWAFTFSTPESASTTGAVSERRCGQTGVEAARSASCAAQSSASLDAREAGPPPAVLSYEAVGHERLPNGRAKMMILRAVDHARDLCRCGRSLAPGRYEDRIPCPSKSRLKARCVTDSCSEPEYGR